MTEIDQGVGNCSKRAGGLGHVWKSWRVDPFRSCVHCGTHGREPAVNFDGQGEKPNQGGGYFAEATMSRADLFGPLKAPMQSGTGDPAKAWPKGIPPAVAAKAKVIRADKSRRDQEARGR